MSAIIQNSAFKIPPLRLKSHNVVVSAFKIPFAAPRNYFPPGP
jgi:hypothetical protein